MAYVPYSAACNLPNSATPISAAKISRQNARVNRIGNQFVNGNQILGNLVTECCSDPNRGGQGYTSDDTAADLGTASLVPASASSASSATGSGGAASTASTVSVATVPSYPLTPVDIITGTKGFSMTRSGSPWPRPKLPRSLQRAAARAYPNYGANQPARGLVPNCPCLSNAAPVALAVPAIVTPAPAAPVAVPVPTASCPYPACSTGNICLDLVTGCVLDSQVTTAQILACADANYGVFGNMGTWLGQVAKGCQNPPYLGMVTANPPRADPSMRALLNQAQASASAYGLSGLGQDDSSNVGGFLAVVAMFGIVVWAIRK